jgi:hypothetical protein
VIQLPEWTSAYREHIRKLAIDLGSDGCSWVPDFYLDACYEHDVHFRTHKTYAGDPITFDESNHWFGERIKSSSIFGRWSPMAWWRERGVSKFGRGAWEDPNQGSPFCDLYCDSIADNIRRTFYKDRTEAP